jgi:hypothetical protein
MSLLEHALEPSREPRDPERLISSLQRLVPFDLFDPDEAFMETAYLDEELRITKTHGTKFGTVKNIYLRNGTDLLAYAREQQNYWAAMM